MNIFEIDREIAALIDDETGEVSNLDALMELQMARDRKVENLACAVKNYLAEAEAIKAERDKLADRESVCRNKARRAMDYLEAVLAGESFESPRCKVSWRKSESVQIDDEDRVVSCLEGYGLDSMVKYTRTVNKAEVKKLLKEGKQIPGACLVEKMNMGVK